MRKTVLILAAIVSIALFSCSKETSLETGITPPPGGGGGGGGTGGGSGCNNTVMRLTKMHALFDANQYISMAWTPGGQVDKIVMNLQLTDYLTARYIYENNRIKEAVLIDHNNGNAIVDTVVYRYNASGAVDSMYRKGGGFNRSLKYDASGKLTRITRWENNGDIMYYWTIQSDVKGNIKKAEEFWDDGSGGFDKTAEYLFSHDDKKNPFQGMGPYMLELDDEYGIFRHWGANNYIDQTYTDPALGISLVTGWKNRYNSNCYPTKGQNTIMGTVLFPNDDDWEYFYQ